jgi:hypothetical protein
MEVISKQGAIKFELHTREDPSSGADDEHARLDAKVMVMVLQGQKASSVTDISG